jgi:hypothetical protein
MAAGLVRRTPRRRPFREAEKTRLKLTNVFERKEKMKISKKQGIKAMASICLIWCLTVVSSARAEDTNKSSTFSPKQGTYIGLLYVNNGMSGDFDDTLFAYTATDAYDIPDLDDGTGFGIVLGGRVPKGAVEISYQRTTHDTSSTLLGDSEATYNIIEFNLKFDVLARDRLRPYIQLGFGIPWLTIKDGQIDLYDLSQSDETFYGFALNAGVGLAYYLDPQWAITGGIVYRWNWFSSVEDADLEDNLSENALNLTIGVTYTF